MGVIVSRRRWRRGLVLGMLVLALAAVAGLPVSAATPRDVLVIGISGDVDNLDPHVTMTNRSWAVTYPAYQRLVRYKVENGVGSTEVEPDLATGWTVSDDGLVWEFTLRRTARFADGTPVDAHAVVYSFNRMMAIGEGPADSFPTLSKVEAVDDYTVRFTLSDPFAPFLLTLANNGAAIVNPRLEEHAQGGDLGRGYLAEHTMGSGPYQLERWDKDQQIRLVPNPYYDGPAPAFRMVVFQVIKDPSARRLQLERGDIDIAEALPLDQLERLRSMPGIRVEDHPSLRVTYLYLNNRRAPLNDPRVRQAISYAVDYDAIIQGVMLGNAVQMRGPVPQGMWSHDPEMFQYRRDLDKARALLAEAGANNLRLGYLYSPVYPEWEQIGLALQAQLAEVGIQLELQPYAYATMRAMLGDGDFDIAVGNWTPDFADPYMFMNYWFDSDNGGLPGNRSFYSNPEVDRLIRQAAVVTDIAERTRLYQEAQRIVVDEAAYVYLYQQRYQVAMRDNVVGYVFNPMLLDIYNVDTMSKR
ncbi:MAG: peptide ABC transporter substrate-binding protein [Firmicutes bacterium ZCTH02-B6]|nr:MAG: peptide ABC transporter substrate-binding protein [Firmicutes bacterium ZCTH02-B6]